MTLLLLSTIACTDSSSDTGVEVPTLAFLAPADGAVVAAGDVSVSLIAEHVALAARTELAVPGLLWLADSVLATAHAHEDGTTPEGSIALSLDGVPLEVLIDTTTTVGEVAVGDHTLTAELLDDTDGSWDPVVIATVHFTAE